MHEGVDLHEPLVAQTAILVPRTVARSAHVVDVLAEGRGRSERGSA